MNSIFNGQPFISMRVTERCNFRCKYCGNKFRNEDMTEDVAFESLDKIKRFFAAKGGSSFDILFNGGEPLLMSGLIKKILLSLPENCGGRILTNGSLISGLEDLYEVRDRISLTISQDGDLETQLRNRNESVSMEFINIGKEFKNLSISRTLSPDNVHKMIPDFYYLKELTGGKMVTHTLNGCWKWDEEQRQLLKQGLLDIFIHDTTHEPLVFPYAFRRNSITKQWESDKSHETCCNRSFTVLADGTICFCYIDYILDLDKKFDFEKSCSSQGCHTIEKPAPCQACKFSSLCGYCSVAFNDLYHKNPESYDNNESLIAVFNGNHDLNPPDSILCFYYKTLNELLEEYGDKLLWNTFAYTKNTNLLNSLIGAN